MFPFKAINKYKSNYKSCCLSSSKGFSTLVKTSFSNLIASVISAASKPLIMESSSFPRWKHVSTIPLVWKGFTWLSLRDTFKSPGAISFENCLLTLLWYHVLNLLQMIFLLLDLRLYPRAESYWKDCEEWWPTHSYFWT